MSNEANKQESLKQASYLMSRAESCLVNIGKEEFAEVSGKLIVQAAKALGAASVHNSTACEANGHVIEGEVEESYKRFNALWDRVQTKMAFKAI